MNESRQPIGSDLSKVDAHQLSDDEYQELPEVTGQCLSEADEYMAGRLVRRGRPRVPVTKTAVSIRFSADVLSYFRATGPGWQTRMDAALREWIEERRR
jgi:uncharacterized protein (DUF4415 family)